MVRILYGHGAVEVRKATTIGFLSEGKPALQGKVAQCP